MSKVSSHSKPFVLIRSLAVSYVLTGLLLLGLAFLMYKCDISTSQVNLGIHAIYMVTCLTGGLLCAKSIHSRRMLWGLLTGMLYFLVLFAISLVVNGQQTGGMPHFFAVLALCALGGALGGVIS